MNILIRVHQFFLNRSSTIDTLEIQSNTILVSELKRILEEKYKIIPAFQLLTYKMYDKTLVTMTDDWPLSFFQIHDKSLIYLTNLNSLHKPYNNKTALSTNESNEESIKDNQIVFVEDVIELIISSVKKNNLKYFNELLEQYSFRNLNQLNCNGWNSLHFACYYGYIEFVFELINKYNVDPNCKTRDMLTPLHLATIKNKCDIVSILVSLDTINVNENNEQHGTPLHCACKMNNRIIISILLFKANSYIRDANGKMPIDLTDDPKTKRLINEHIYSNTESAFSTNNNWTIEQINKYPFLKMIDYIPPTPPIVLGWMEKKGNLLPIYRSRFIEINPLKGLFSRFKSQTDYPNIPNGVIRLKDIQHCQIENNLCDYKSDIYYFSLLHNQKEWYKVESKEVCNKWIDLIKLSIKYFNFKDNIIKKYKDAINYFNTQKIETIVIDYSSGIMKESIIKDQNENDNEKHCPYKNCKSSLISIDSFELLELLGSGSFGKVFKVNLKRSNKLFAMKIIEKSSLKHKKQISYALTECNVLKQLNNPFIVTLHYAFQNEDNLFMILDYCSKGDLLSFIQNNKLSEEEAKFYIAELILAIEYLQENDIIYRDLKPENILINSDGHIKLTDFGLAKENMANNSVTNSFCGSPAYLPPEMLSKQGVGKKADIYGIGVVLYEMINGYPPYYTNDIDALYNNIINQELNISENISVPLQDLLKKLLHKDPFQRINIQEIKKHSFFDFLDWDKLEQKEINPPVNLLNTNLKKVNTFLDQQIIANKPYDSCHINLRINGFSFIRNNEKEKEDDSNILFLQYYKGK